MQGGARAPLTVEVSHRHIQQNKVWSAIKDATQPALKGSSSEQAIDLVILANKFL
jgi:hypothetical protein